MFAALLFGLRVIQIPMISGMLNLGQLQECAQDIKMEQGLVIFSRGTKVLRAREMNPHGIDGRLNVMVAFNTARH